MIARLGIGWRPLIALALLLVFDPPAMGAGPPAGANEVVRLAVNAKGGAKAISKERKLYIKARKAIKEGELSRTVISEQWIDGDKRMRETERITDTRASGSGVSVKRFTRTVIQESREPADGSYLAKIMFRMRSVEELTPLLVDSRLYSVSLEREEKVGKHEALTIRVKNKDLPDMLLSFDRRSWLLVKREVWIPVFFEKIHHQTLFFDYKEVDGVLFPSKITWAIGELDGEAEYLERRRLDKIDDKLFR